MSEPEGPAGWAHLALVLAVSTGFELLFLHHGVGWLFDEGLPLYAALWLERGGELYTDAFFPFPPGHALPALVARALDPPGVLAARALYAAFTVALCGVLYLLGRRIMPPRFALLAALAVAVAAPRGHMAHYLFGYRYLVWSALALLCLDRRLRGGGPAWSAAAGALVGAALAFRLTPAASAAAAFAAAVVAARPRPRDWLREGALFAAGAAAVALPVLGWIAAGPGLDAAWREVVVRIAQLQVAQGLPVPPLAWEGGSRDAWIRLFVAVQYRAYPLLFGAYALVLAARAVSAWRREEPFRQGLLLAVAVWGGVNFLRTLGRSDEAHLVSALPPACLLWAHALHLGVGRAARELRARPRRVAEWTAVGLALAAWIVLVGSDRFLSPEERGRHPVAAVPGLRVPSAAKAREIDAVVAAIREHTAPGDTVLNLAFSPLFHALTGRTGPGGPDVVMPGTFLSAAEEERFLERLRRDPPAAVIWPRHPFDGMPSRHVTRTAPRVAAWVRAHYAPIAPGRRWLVLLPGSAGGASGGS